MLQAIGDVQQFRAALKAVLQTLPEEHSADIVAQLTQAGIISNSPSEGSTE